MENTMIKSENNIKDIKQKADSKTCFERLNELPDNLVCLNENCEFNLSRACKNCAIVQVIRSRYGSLTLQEIGDLYDLSRMRICQIEKSIIDNFANSCI